MKTIIFLFGFLAAQAQPFNFQRTWATYYGNENLSIKDQAIDSQGNVYIVGMVAEPVGETPFNFSTGGAYHTIYGGGEHDGFITKFAPAGNVLWASYFGGEGDDCISAITIDKNDRIFITGGTTSTANITTQDVFQHDLNGESDQFIASFTVSGSIVWSTYYGGSGADAQVSGSEYSIAFDDFENLYLITPIISDGLGTSGTFQPNRSGSKHLISKFTKAGNKLWSTYYGSNGSGLRSIAVNNTGIYVAGIVADGFPYTPTTYFGTAGSYQPVEASVRDIFISKFSFNGERLWGTYYGGSLAEYVGKNCLATYGTSIYIAGNSASLSGVASPGAFQETVDQVSDFLLKFNENGERLWGTYCGLNPLDNLGISTATVSLDMSGNPYLSGTTKLQDNIGTSGSFQETKSGSFDDYIVKFNPDGERQWGTYYGGSNEDDNNGALFFGDSFYLIGLTASQSGISTTNGLQPNFLVNGEAFGAMDIFIVKFDPIPLARNVFETGRKILYPNPTESCFTFEPGMPTQDLDITIYNSLGQTVSFSKSGSKICLSQPRGVYYLQYKNEPTRDACKIIVK